MVTDTSLKQQLEAQIQTIEDLTAGLSEEAATQEPSQGEWCAKEVLSHLAGSEAKSFVDGIRSFLDENTPEYDLVPGESFYEQRKDITAAELREQVLSQYRSMAELIGRLSADDLQRTAHMPAFKETPLGEHPALGLWIGGIVNYHLPSHIEQLQALCK